jgi:hypothetical protein
MINHELISKLKHVPRLGMATPPPPPPVDPAVTSTYAALGGVLDGVVDAITSLNSATALQINGAGRLINIYQTQIRKYTDAVKALTWLEKRNESLNKSFGLSVKQSAIYGQKLDEVSVGFKKGGDEIRKYAENLQTVIDNYKVVGRGYDDFGKKLLRTQEIVTTSLGLSAEQAANFEFFATKGASNGNEQLVVVNSIAKSIEDATGQQGLFKQITGDLADLSADVQMQYSRLPGQLEVATVKAKQLGISVTQLSKTGKQLLNIESSIGDELEYQLLSGRRLVNEQGKSLTNEFRVAQLRGDASKQADLMNDILEREGETLENNLFAREQMSKLLGVDEATLARSLQKKKLLEKIGGEALFNLSGKELFEAAKGLGASADDLATLAENEDKRSTESILQSIEKKLITDGIRVNIPDQVGAITDINRQGIETTQQLASSMAALGGPAVATGIGAIERAAAVISAVASFSTDMQAAYNTGGWAGVITTLGKKALGEMGSGNAPMDVDLPAAATSLPQHRAKGGPVAASTPYIVGEIGPELFVPDSAGTIIPNNQLAGSGAGADVTALANAIVAAFQSGVKLHVTTDPTFSGAGMNNPRYS